MDAKSTQAKPMGTKGFALALAPPIALGLFLRLWRLDAQILGGDELHAVRLLFASPLSALLTTYQPTDVSLPLMGLLRILSDAGVRLSEMHFRAPSVLSGALLLVLAPVLLRPRIGTRAALWLAWLLAISPLLVFYSRFARSYAPMTLLVFCAIHSFLRWWQTRRPGWALLYVALAALAVYLHLGAAPFVAAPFLYALLSLARRREGAERLRGLAGVGLALLAALALFLVPAAESLRHLLTFQRAAQAQLPPGWDPSALFHLAGSHSPWVAAAFWLLAARGLVLLVRRRDAWGPCSGLTVLGGVGGIAFLTSGTQPRYVIAALPFVLAWLAVGLATPLPRLPRRAGSVLAGGMLLALVATGPLVDPRLRNSSFMHHNDFLLFQHRLPPADPARVSSVYARLDALHEAGPIVEFPWISSWHATRALPLAQQQHGREVRVSSPLPWLYDPRLALRNVVRPDVASILASGAVAVVLHLDLDAEERNLAPDWMPLPDPMPGAQTRREQTRALARALEQRLGPPDFRDRLALAWDLTRVRATRSGRPPHVVDGGGKRARVSD
jgi:hypothetical protein